MDLYEKLDALVKKAEELDAVGDKFVDFDALNIKFKGVRFDDAYDAIFKAQQSTDDDAPVERGDKFSRAKKLFNEGRKACDDSDFRFAIVKVCMRARRLSSCRRRTRSNPKFSSKLKARLSTQKVF